MSARITRVLVANRGEIARRVFRTCRTLGIETVAVFSDPDHGAPFVCEADVAVRLPGDAAADTYLRGDLVIAAALKTGADAIHPGYGFLSEDAAFARAVVEAGLTWIGPDPATIEAMGSKVRAKELMASAGVPILQVVSLASASPQVSGPELCHSADNFPVLVKASAGGGGRGMRVVERSDDLDVAIAAASAEAESAFGDGTVFVEPYLPTARHVEVQVMADRHGTCWILGERDCSIQRRHQKVVEETPAPDLGEAVRTTLNDAARAAVKAVGYVGAGTVEFLVSAGDVYFLEMNTRLQVEHPVTECVTGLDLVALQIGVAEGEPLDGDPPASRGHAIEVRLYAEDPADGYQPQTGVIRAFDVPDVVDRFAGPPRFGLRVDSGVESGSVVGIHYDAMLAKIVAWGPDRAAALRILAGGLRRTRLHGVRTNLDLLVAILSDEDFRGGRVHTTLLDERLTQWAQPRLDDAALRHCASAAAIAQAHHAAARADVQHRIPPAFRNVTSQPRTRTYSVGGREITVSYLDERGHLRLCGVGDLEVVRQGSADVALSSDGVVETYTVVHHGDVVDVDGALGSISLVVVPRFVDPADEVALGSLLAPMPATVMSVAVEEGQRVSKGQPVVVLEAMKMQHTITAPDVGVVTELAVAAGAQVESGAVLAVVEPTQPTEGEPDD